MESNLQREALAGVLGTVRDRGCPSPDPLVGGSNSSALKVEGWKGNHPPCSSRLLSTLTASLQGHRYFDGAIGFIIAIDAKWLNACNTVPHREHTHWNGSPSPD